MNECPVCGGTVEDSVCQGCGRNVEFLDYYVCPSCGEEVCADAHGDNCPACGHNRYQQVYACSNCGASLSYAGEFCENCGNEE